MKKRIVNIIAIIVMLLTATVSAEADVDIRYDYNNSEVIITSEKAENFATIQILRNGKNIDSFTDDDVLYRSQFENTGTFVVGYELNSGEYGIYNGYFMTDNNESITPFELTLIPFSDFKLFYEDIEAAGSTEEIEKIINERRIFAGFDNELTKGHDLSGRLSNYAEFVKENPIDIEKNEENKKVFLTYMLAEALNRNEIENVDEYIDILSFSCCEYDEIVVSEEIQKYFTKKLSGNDIKNQDEFKDAFKKALVVTCIRYSDGYGEVKEILNAYGDVFGINKTYKNDIYKALCGNDYEIFELKEELEKIADNKTQSTSGGGSGSGGGRKSYSQSTTYVPVTSEVWKIPVVFDDIDGVAWASEAILALADKNIINGKTEGKFMPDEAITREEFVKILVGALSLTDADFDDAGFYDVENGTWYYKYVNIAAEYGIVNGIGEGLFGVGKNITREELVTMIYRVLTQKNVQMNTKLPEFSDMGEVSDYAEDAVSALYNLGVINGVSDTEFSPKSYATRAQSAKIVYGILELL